MMMNQDELFDRYLRGELPEEEKLSLEARIEADPSLRKQFEEHMELIRLLKISENEKKFSDVLRKIETNYHKGIIPLRTEKISRPFIHELIFSLKVAAIALVVSIITLFIWWKTLYKSQVPSHEITNLKLQIHGLQYYQKTIQNKLKKNFSQNAMVPDIPIFQGTAFFIHPDGYLLTSYHIIQSADSVIVSGTRMPPVRANVLAVDSILDIALLKISPDQVKEKIHIPFSVLDSPSSLGERVFTLGYPGTEQVYGEGALSALNGFDGDTTLYQVSLPLNPGNSGCPVWDQSGKLIGIVRGKNFAREGNSYAVKSVYLSAFLRKNGLKGIAFSRSSSGTPVRIKHFLSKNAPLVLRVYAWQKLHAD